MGNGAVIILRQIESALESLKYRSLVVRKGKVTYYYVCTHCEYNWFLNRYYPKAELIMICESFY